MVPFLAYTDARKRPGRWCASAGRCSTPPANGRREMSQVGALYPWRTINGEEASAYYAAGTAQYHINAAVVLALRRYLEASGDIDFLVARGRGDPRGDRTSVGRPRLLRTERRPHVPHPPGHRARRVHDRRQRQLLHERDGEVQSPLCGAHRAVPVAVEPRGVRVAGPSRPISNSRNSTTGTPPRTACSSRSTKNSGSTRRTPSSSNWNRGTGRPHRPTTTRCC